MVVGREVRNRNNKGIFMKKVFFATTSLALLAGSAALAAPAIVDHGTGLDPLVGDIFVPCANNGAGEQIHLDGYVHYAYTSVMNGSRYTVTQNYNPQGLTGIGDVTGDVYHATGKTSLSFSGDVTDDMPLTYTFVNRFHFVAAGTGNDFYMKDTVHFTVNPAGEVTVDHSFSGITCK